MNRPSPINEVFFGKIPYFAHQALLGILYIADVAGWVTTITSNSRRSNNRVPATEPPPQPPSAAAIHHTIHHHLLHHRYWPLPRGRPRINPLRGIQRTCRHRHTTPAIIISSCSNSNSSSIPPITAAIISSIRPMWWALVPLSWRAVRPPLPSRFLRWVLVRSDLHVKRTVSPDELCFLWNVWLSVISRPKKGTGLFVKKFLVLQWFIT